MVSMIGLSSRYASSEVIPREDPRTGTPVLSVMRSWTAGTGDSFLYKWKDGDRPDAVMARLGLPPASFHVFLDINPHITDPAMIIPGTFVRVPDA